MTARRTLAIARKELIQVRRDPRSLLIAVFMPLLLMALLGYGARLDARRLPVWVLDRDGTPESQALLHRFRASPYFDLARIVDREAALVAGLDAGHARLGLVVPAEFARRLRSGAPVTVQALVDASDDNAANLAIGYAEAVIERAEAEVQLEWIRRRGLPARALAPPLSIEARTWYNEELDSRHFIIPGVVALALALVGALLASLAVAREWERGTMEQLVSTPVTAAEILLGKLLPYFAIGMADAALCVVVAVEWFDVPFRGAVATLTVATALFLLVTLLVALLISVSIRSQVGASQIAILATLLPFNMLSGFAFPIDQMPAPIRAVTYAVWGRYYVTAIKAVLLKGSTLADLLAPLGALALYAAAVGVLAARRFRKSLG